MHDATQATETTAAPLVNIGLAVEVLPGGGYNLHVDGKRHRACTSPGEVQDAIGDLVAERFNLSQQIPGAHLPQDMPGFMRWQEPEVSFEQERAEAFEAVEAAKKAYRLPASVNMVLALLAGIGTSLVGV